MILDFGIFKVRVELVRATKTMLIGPNGYTGIFINREEAEKEAKRRYRSSDCCRFQTVK